MATQEGITVAAANDPWKVVKDIARPKPGHKQVLVKSVVTSINPVPWMQHTGMLVVSWPVVLGCDASGVVLEAGPGCTKLKAGDHVFGCTRVGDSQYSTFQETFLMDEDLTFKRPSGLSTEAAATIGVGLETSAIGLLHGAKLSLPAPGSKAKAKDEWIIILGASGAVGQFGVQLAVLAGYRVLASCSASKASVPKSHGAEATLNGRAPTDEQLAEVKKITGGNFSYIFDASAYGYELGLKALETVSTKQTKWFGTVDDFSDLKFSGGIESYRVRLGAVGHSKENNIHGPEVTPAVKEFLPTLDGHVADGTLRPLEYEVVDGAGWASVLKGIELSESGKGSGKKIVVKIQDE